MALGVLLGLAVSAALLSVFDGLGSGSSATALRGPVLSDCDGPLRELAIHYVSAAAEVAGPTYCDFLRQLPAGVTVHVVCPDRAAFDELCSRVGAVQCVLSPVVVGHPITVWSRDRWLALAPAGEGDATTLLCPRGELGTEVWPARAGDQRVAADLAAALHRDVTSVRSELYFDGGDFVADDQTVFVTPAVLLRNLQQTMQTREELIEQLSALLKRRVVLLRDAPDHHAGMYMMPVGNRTVLVGDPAAAQRLLAESGDEGLASLCPKQGPDFTEATRAKFEAVAEQCRAAGYRVIRIPTVPGRDGRTYVTYVNAILDQRKGSRTVYMPAYGRAEVLNRAAAEVWSRLGYEVRSVNCDACSPHFGSLHCLVNVVRRG
jgi:N-dimethylarginine dimethylaminohydrolase